MTGEFFKPPEYGRNPEDIARALNDVFGYMRTVDAGIIQANPDLHREFTTRIEAGMPQTTITRNLLRSQSEEAILADQAAQRARAGLGPALARTGLSLGREGSARMPDIADFRAFDAALAVIQPPQDERRRDVLQYGFSMVAYRLADRLVEAELAGQAAQVRTVYGENIPSELTNIPDSASRIAHFARGRVNHYLPTMLSRLKQIGIDPTAENELAAFNLADEEGLTFQWALLEKIEAFTTDNFVNAFSHSESFDTLAAVVYDIRNRVGAQNVFLHGLRDSLLAAIEHARTHPPSSIMRPDGSIEISDPHLAWQTRGWLNSWKSAIDSILPPPPRTT
jgi:hypothetical protein